MGTIALAALATATAANAASAAGEAAAGAAKAVAPGSQVTEVEEVRVTGKYLEESLPLDLGKIGNRVQLIQSEAIQRRVIPDVAGALQIMAPAVSIRPKSGDFDYVDVSLEGSRTNEILWLVDGVRINNRLYNGTTPLDTIPASIIERIEVLEGGQGIFYGTQSVAGVINVITKSLSKQTHGQFGVGYDTNNGRHMSGYVASAAGPHEFVVYGSSDQSKGYQPFDTAEYQPSATDRNRSYDVVTLGAKYGIDLTSDLRTSVGYQHTHAVLDFSIPYLISQYYNERYEDLATAKLDWKPSDQFNFFIKSYYHWWNSYVNRYDNSIPVSKIVTHTKDRVFWGYKDYGINALAKYTVRPGVDLYGGYDFQNYSGRDDSLLIGQQTEQVHALFGQVRTTEDLFSKASFAAGFRFNKPKSGKAITIWNVSGRYNLNENLFAQASAGTSYRLPDASELYSIDPCCEQGNPSLQGEQSTNINASVGGHFTFAGNAGTWELVGFAREVKNLIRAVPNAAGIAVYQNTAAQTRVDGFLITTSLGLGQDFTVNASYSATDAQVKGTSRQIDRVPEAIAKASLEYHPDNLPVGGALDVNYTGRTFVTLSGGLGRVPYGDVTTADLSAYFVFGHENRSRITARLQNITDEEYTTLPIKAVRDIGAKPYVAHYLGVPRTFHIGYTYDF